MKYNHRKDDTDDTRQVGPSRNNSNQTTCCQSHFSVTSEEYTAAQCLLFSAFACIVHSVCQEEAFRFLPFHLIHLHPGHQEPSQRVTESNRLRPMEIRIYLRLLLKMKSGKRQSKSMVTWQLGSGLKHDDWKLASWHFKTDLTIPTLVFFNVFQHMNFTEEIGISSLQCPGFESDLTQWN